MAIGMIFEPKGLTQAQYDRVRAEVSPDNALPAGMLHHSAGPGPDGWVVMEVWESPEAAQRFFEGTLRAALERAKIEVQPRTFQIQNTMH